MRDEQRPGRPAPSNDMPKLFDFQGAPRWAKVATVLTIGIVAAIILYITALILIVATRWVF